MPRPQAPAPGRRGRALAVAAALALLLPAAAAGPVLGLSAQAASATVVPVTLAAGNGCNGQCTTTLNSAGTLATVGAVNIVPGQGRQVVKVVHGALPWSVQVRATGATGLAATDSITLTLAGPTSATLALGPATAYPATSAAVALAGGAGAADLSLSARGVCVATCTLALEIVLASGTARYSYGVTATVT